MNTLQVHPPNPFFFFFSFSMWDNWIRFSFFLSLNSLSYNTFQCSTNGRTWGTTGSVQQRAIVGPPLNFSAFFLFLFFFPFSLYCSYHHSCLRPSDLEWMRANMRKRGTIPSSNQQTRPFVQHHTLLAARHAPIGAMVSPLLYSPQFIPGSTHCRTRTTQHLSLLLPCLGVHLEKCAIHPATSLPLERPYVLPCFVEEAVDMSRSGTGGVVLSYKF